MTMEQLNNQQKVGGYIRNWGLAEWWFDTFTNEEREYINYRVRTWRAGPDTLIIGNPRIDYKSTHSNVSYFLIGLVNWFKAPKDNSIARRIALKAYELAEEIEDISWSLNWVIRLHFYARKTVPGVMDLVIKCCQHQIALAPLVVEKHRRQLGSSPIGHHEGYNHYVIYLEKQKKYSEVIRLCKEAKEQGWTRESDKRIERCSRKLNGNSLDN
jgi:hypothetical protein